MKNKKIKEVNYYWLDHLFIREIPKLMNVVETCIDTHDYKTFTALQIILNNFDKIDHIEEFPELDNSPMLYLPDEIQIVYDDGTSEYEEITEENFKLITHSEYECG